MKVAEGASDWAKVGAMFLRDPLGTVALAMLMWGYRRGQRKLNEDGDDE